MHIEVDKYVITSDPYNIILNEKKTAQKGRTKGEIYLFPIAYYQTVEDCIEGIVDHGIKNSEATSFKELIIEIKKLKKILEKKIKEA